MGTTVQVLTEALLTTYGIAHHGLTHDDASRAAIVTTRSLNNVDVHLTADLWLLYNQAVDVLRDAPKGTAFENATVTLDRGAGLDRMRLG